MTYHNMTGGGGVQPVKCIREEWAWQHVINQHFSWWA